MDQEQICHSEIIWYDFPLYAYPGQDNLNHLRIGVNENVAQPYFAVLSEMQKQ